MRKITVVVAGMATLLSLAATDLGAGDFVRIVGAVSPTGDGYLVKHFTVPRGSIVRGVEFYSNDTRTTFPEVMLLQGPFTTIAGAKVIAKVSVVPTLADRRAIVAHPPVAFDSDVDLYVAVRLPSSDGVRGVGDGAGIIARGLTGPTTSYFAPDRNTLLGPMDVDYGIELVFEQVGKAAKRNGVAEPITSFVRGSYPGLSGPSISFGVERADEVSLGIYDVAGRRVRTLVDGWLLRGVYTQPWDGLDEGGQSTAAGIYFARLKVGEKTLTTKLFVAK